jgi:hypothetical protein
MTLKERIVIFFNIVSQNTKLQFIQNGVLNDIENFLDCSITFKNGGSNSGNDEQYVVYEFEGYLTSELYYVKLEGYVSSYDGIMEFLPIKFVKAMPAITYEEI